MDRQGFIEPTMFMPWGFNLATTLQSWTARTSTKRQEIARKIGFQFSHDFAVMDRIAMDKKIKKGENRFNLATTLQSWTAGKTCRENTVAAMRFNLATTLQSWTDWNYGTILSLITKFQFSHDFAVMDRAASSRASG